MRIGQNYSLEKHNTFHLPVKTRWFVEYETEEELQRILHDEYFQECLSLHIGGGDNLLFANDYDGIIIHSRIKGIPISVEADEYVSPRIEVAEIWDDIVVYAVSKGWGGIENLSLMPGEAGVAVIQSIGAYDMETKNMIEGVEAYSRSTLERWISTNSDCEYGYRNGYFKNEYHDSHITTYITLRLSKNSGFSVNCGNLEEELTKYLKVTLETIREAVTAVHRQKLPDPEVLGNANSFFMNPVTTVEHFEKLKKQFPEIPSYPVSEGKIKVSADWLIGQCGFGGKDHGSTGVYEKQALVLVNLGDARGDEIALVAESVRTTVRDRFGVELMPEVKYVG